MKSADRNLHSSMIYGITQKKTLRRGGSCPPPEVPRLEAALLRSWVAQSARRDDRDYNHAHIIALSIQRIWPETELLVICKSFNYWMLYQYVFGTPGYRNCVRKVSSPKLRFSVDFKVRTRDCIDLHQDEES